MMNYILEASQSYSHEDSVFNLARRCNLLINNMLLVEWIISKRCTQEAAFGAERVVSDANSGCAD